MKESGSQVYFYKQQTPFMEKFKNFTTHDIQSSAYSDKLFSQQVYMTPG